jgi:exodeoxyribonuclease V alpha subunit
VLLQRGVLAELDLALARTLLDLVGERGAEVELAIALASWAVQRGHVCADLRKIAEQGFFDEEGKRIEGIAFPELARWLSLLRQSKLVQLGGAASRPLRPLVMTDQGCLYLARYFGYEQRLAQALLERARIARHDMDRPLLETRLESWFPAHNPASEGQRRACALAASRTLSVISGGPGTGKTYSVGKILLLLQEQAKARGERCEVLLLAPTGKAAQRLGETLAQQLQGVPDEQRAGIPTEASTIHRALGYQQKSPTRFRHDQQNPLSADVVVVDETSMVDLALMSKLVVAVRPQARLILLGDKDQLASVEAGAIFGDICRGLKDDVVHLTHVHRFAGEGPIAALARAVNAGDSNAALSVLNASDATRLVEVAPGAKPQHVLRTLALEHFFKLGHGSVVDKLAALSAFRFLCAHRRGPWGVEGINAWVQALLHEEGILQDATSDWFEGRPILVTENDYALELFNGDIGVIGRDESSQQLTAAFPGHGNAIRRLPPAQLPAHETVFAMSVHKSQGSELDEVALILPEQSSPVLTRELIYTAITRARSRVVIFGSRAVLTKAIETPVQRTSGLSQLLWK